MNKKHNEEMFDSLIRHAGHEILDESAHEAPSNSEASEQAGSTEELDRMMQKVINRDIGRRRIRKAGKFALRAAVVILVMLAVSTVAVLSSEALRVNFLNMLITVGDKATEITFTDEDDVDVPEDVVVPEYLPKGYIFDEVLIGDGSYSSIYRNSDGVKLIIEQYQIKSNIAVDNERHETKMIEIDGKEAYVFYNDEGSILVFYTDGNTFVILGRIDEKEIERVAESMVK